MLACPHFPFSSCVEYASASAACPSTATYPSLTRVGSGGAVPSNVCSLLTERLNTALCVGTVVDREFFIFPFSSSIFFVCRILISFSSCVEYATTSPTCPSTATCPSPTRAGSCGARGCGQHQARNEECRRSEGPRSAIANNEEASVLHFNFLMRAISRYISVCGSNISIFSAFTLFRFFRLLSVLFLCFVSFRIHFMTLCILLNPPNMTS